MRRVEEPGDDVNDTQTTLIHDILILHVCEFYEAINIIFNVFRSVDEMPEFLFKKCKDSIAILEY